MPRRAQSLPRPSPNPEQPCRKFALSLAVLSIGWAPGENQAYHRYCIEIVAPLLRTLRERAEVRLSIAASGCELMFLAAEYPSEYRVLLDLVARGQIEVISPTYAPYSWWHYPGSDLLRSVELNRRDLKKIGIEPSRTFFGADGHVGPGLRRLAGTCDTVVCDGARLPDAPAEGPAVYDLLGVTLIPASNRISTEIRRHAPPDELSFFEASSAFERAATAGSSERDSEPCRIGDVEWCWWHFGGAHELCCRHAPTSPHNFFYDPLWAERSLDAIESLGQGGYRLETVGRFAEYVRSRGLQVGSAPPFLDTPIDIREDLSGGREAGRESRRAAQASVLTMGWKTRNALSAVNFRECQSEATLEAWRQHQMALFWPSLSIAAPGPELIRYCKASAEAAYRQAKVAESLRLGSCPQGPSTARPMQHLPVRPLVDVSFFGADASCAWEKLDASTAACHVYLIAEQEECGVCFAGTPKAFAYSPSGLEDELVSLPEAADKKELTLPLANGLIRLTEDLYLIRINEKWAGPATVLPGEPRVWFTASGLPEGGIFEWSFLVVRATPEHALRMATRLNFAS